MTNIRSLLLLLIFTAISTDLWATHIRAGEITAVRISQSSLRYRFTLILYKDTGSPVQIGEGGIFNFGQGRTIGPGRAALEQESVDGSFDERVIGNETLISVIQFDHTFDGPGVYVISYTEQNRNGGIINMGGASSEEIPFHIETVIRIDPGLDVNGTPQLTIPPIDRACIGSRFIHNPGAYDPDGDSLAYKIVTPLQDRGVEVRNYVPLDDPAISDISEDGGPTEFSIDPLTGDLVWDAPKFAGEYNVAFIIEEWRFSQLTGRYELLGYVTRDMQILVEECDNERPELEIPADTCIEAGTLLEAEILGRDPDGNKVLMEAFGGVFGLNSNAAEYLSLPGLNANPEFRDSPATSLFRWQTDLSHVRARPYQVQFKITDDPSDPEAPELVDFATWNIQVVAPAPTGLTSAVDSGLSIELNWDDYIGANYAPTMQIYRRVDSYDFDPENCIVGIPPQSGYELIDELPIDQTNYIDDNDVRPGVKYCYRLVAEFPLPEGGTSYASIETCTTIPLDVPAITNVSIENTGMTDGGIFVKWTSPLEINPILFPPPYRYELIRYQGFDGNVGRTQVTSTLDTTFMDTGLNTEGTPYHYMVRFYDNADNLIDSSATASSVRLEALGLVQAVELSWEADVPWSNRVQSFPYHYIYRNRADIAANDTDNFVLIDSTLVTADGFTYLDEGQFNSVPLLEDREYCYYVVTQGSYGNPIIPAPLVNNSQVVCIQPNDEDPPEEPEIEIPGDSTTVEGPDGTPLIILDNPNCDQLQLEPCAFANFSNTLTWTADDVDNDIASFNIYYSTSGAENSFTLVGNTRDMQFTHTGLSSYKGCYKIAAVDRSNNESTLSNSVCFDNCPYYDLPNTFTPNDDGVNDTFRAFDQPNAQCPRFVRSVEFRVFNRWGGKELFTYNTTEEVEPNFFIDWNGTDENGNELPSGTYYYTATVTFDVLDPAKAKQEFKNWVKIIR
ncbi:gliding motility-associated C-terminal domain-containing protein [Roseivirga pacifica]|uniref:T9SS type B sorting domain-containing protein n=1 Tax=Roseivirga pacifica TaxID=1267423 RepID=UPI002095E4C7|nr:gliding motility-associated C-terminal domain-containing protein [Roseivirga pacifica]MCO6358355.1 T9SS type B sorting domain-containing protein [Roseivirga pacifica]MCO6366181.1 T9SS type B sorting domain-containing protein [Roseivirga pacifica]MCO6369268.1 T9SS type B sorting domain-containing protein [Roseivirga pacifica]MCO6374086.1 T9SS type B sorting domain-containing protein [Roseivirga pacifica]MCO6378462.1 T9SS type B sorting domain-containing protein [Roseivirga pacifica]